MESVAAFVWNRWQLCRGIGGRIHLESVAALAWNTQQIQAKRFLWGTTEEQATKHALFEPIWCSLDVSDSTLYKIG